MKDRAYKYYRLSATRAMSSTSISVNEIYLYDTTSSTAATPNKATGAIATSRTSHGGETANLAIDGDINTRWRSAELSGPAEWLKIELPVPTVIRRFGFRTTSFPQFAPRDFVFEGSHDDLVWDTLVERTGNTSTDAYYTFSIVLSGVSKIDTGESALKVYVNNWNTGQLVTMATPNIDGSWSVSLDKTNDLLVTHIGPSGYEPKSDGPITPYAW